MPYATITGQLKDSDGTAWSQATWTAVPVSPSSKPVFPDGSPVPVTGGLLDATGNFSGEIPQTIDVRPPGTTLTITVTSMTSANPVTITKVQIVAADVDLGALLSPRITAPRIKAAAVVYAYNSVEVTNPVHGSGYINTVENQSYIFMQNSWVKIGVGGIPEDVVRLLPTQNNGDLQIDGTIAMEANNAGASVISPASGLLLAHNMGGQHRTALINSAPSGGGFGWYTVPSGVGVNSGTPPTMLLDGPTLTLYLAGGGRIIVPDNINGGKFVVSQQPGGGGALYNSFGVNAGNYAGHTFRLSNLDGSSHFDTLQITSAAGGAVTVNGTLHATGAISSDAGKAFKITHPLDESKLLMHGCIEGPEFGVYYRGEAELVDGRAIVELPDYFEALTFPDDRTVLLTQVDDGGELALLAASRVVDGKFSIRSNVSAAIVSWEVKAVRRAGVDRLEVEQAKTGERSEGEC